LKKLEYVDPDEAFARLVNECTFKMGVDEIEVKNSFGRVLSEDIQSGLDVPLLDSSHLDGYAVRSEDVKGATKHSPIKLRVCRNIELNEIPTAKIGPGEAYKVRTGSYIPTGCDAIAPKEDVTVKGDQIEIISPLKPFAEIIPKGSDLKYGSLVYNSGHIIRSQDLGMLRLLKLETVKVYSKPIVSIASIGSELTEDTQKAGKGKTLNTHAYTISSLVEQAGGKPVYLGIVPDNIDDIKKTISSGLEKSSIMVTIGGSSVGEADFVAEAVSTLGNPGIIAHGLKLHPGRVAGCGVIERKAVIILPGLIQSTINGFVYFVLPLINYLTGKGFKRYEFSVPASIGTDIEYHKYHDFHKMSWVSLCRKGDQIFAEQVKGDSPMRNVLIKANGYIMVQPNIDHVSNGTSVEVFMVPGLSSLPIKG